MTAGLSAVLQASAEGEFLEITFADNTTSIGATAITKGKPFTQTSSAAGGIATLVTATTIANNSKNDVNNADNWSGAATPGNGDTVFFDDTDVAALYNLGSLSAITLTALNYLGSFTGNCGLPEINTDGTAYREYRPDYFAIGATTINIGDNSGTGSGRIKIDTAGVDTTINCYSTGAPLEQDKEAFLWKGAGAGANVVNMFGGTMGVAIFGGESATINTMRMAGGSLRCGAGTTLATIDKTDGTLEIRSNATTVTHKGGTLLTRLSAAITTLTLPGGTVTHDSNGTITTLTVSNTGTIDFGTDPRPVTVTNCTLRSGATLIDRAGRVTFTNPISAPDGLNSIAVIRGGSTNLQFS